MAETEPSISRRDLLRKGAVAGAVAWTAPMVLSSPAFAATGKCSGSKPCTDFYFFQSTGGSNCANSDGSCTYPAIKNCAGQTATLKDACADPNKPQIAINGTTTVGSFTYPPGVVPIFFNAKLGRHCYLVNVNPDLTLSAPTPTPPACNGVSFGLTGTIATGVTITVTVADTSNCSGSGGHGISHLATAYCK